MANLLRPPLGTSGKIHEITPADAGWSYVGFDLFRLAADDVASDGTGWSEAIIVMVEGRAKLSIGGSRFGEIGDRMNVFEQTPPHAVYVPGSTHWNVEATTACTVAVCKAPARTSRPARVIGPDGVAYAERGKGSNFRKIYNIAMEDRGVADSLLVTEVFTPQGNWSSYPPHRHDEDNFPDITYLEETYYHRMNPPQGFGFQRVFTDDRSLDETMTVHDHDVVLVPRGHHPCGAPFGYSMYYLNVMAGPVRKWRFKTHPNHSWLTDFDPDGEPV